MKFLLALALLASAGVMALACGNSDELNEPNSAVPLSERSGSPMVGRGDATLLEPSLDLTEPKEGAAIDGANVTVRVKVTDFKLVDKVGETSESGEGHILFVLDAPDTNDPDSAAKVVETADKELRWTDIAPGEHTFSAYLVNNNGTQLAPKVMEQVKVTVR